MGAAVEAFFVHRDLAPNSRRVYRAALDPLVAAVGAGQPLAALTPAAVAGVFTGRWGGAAPATWNTRRAAVRAFVSWCEDRWPLGADPLASVGDVSRRLRGEGRSEEWEDNYYHHTAEPSVQHMGGTPSHVRWSRYAMRYISATPGISVCEVRVWCAWARLAELCAVR